jgi:hypothetical protein
VKKILSAVAVLAVAGLAWAGCSQNTTPVVVRSLERSGRAAFLCLANPQTATVPSQGLQLDACPDPGNVIGPTDYTIPHFISLVTQTARGEVAIVDVSANTVIDADKSIPGYNFLPVGAAPNDIVATPASGAAFVSIGDPTRPAIFAVPTSKLPLWSDSKAPGFGDWPACALPPGGVPTEMVLVADMTASPSDPGGRRAHCDGSPQVVPGGNVVGVDITAETQLFGRLKLAVALPELGEIDIMDAQDLLYREPGSFDPCVIERRVFLSGDADIPTGDDAGSDVTPVDASDAAVPDATADVSVTDGGASADDGESDDASNPDASNVDASDPDASNPDAGRTDAPGGSDGAAPDAMVCPTRVTPVPPRSNKPHPYAFALADDGRLFVSDDSASVIHVVDLSDPCTATEKPPLWAYSAADPARPVISGAIAVSPLTKDGKRFVYASDVRNNGSLMVYDVSTTSTERTPLVRPDLLFNPFEPPDRVLFSSPIESMTFVTHEVPLGKADPATGVVPRGVLCDPFDPNDVNRPPDDFVSAGAQPRRLRGIFGFLAMSNGELAVLDVDDYDAPCRRPRYTDDEAVGCPEVIPPGPLVAGGGLPSSSQEASCKVFERHRPRSASFFTNADLAGRHAPAMQNYPILYDKDGSAIVSDPSRPATALLPKVLGPQLIEADHDKGSWPILATVLSTLATPLDGSLVSDPTTPEAPNWVTFDVREPRVHSTQIWDVTYEGILPWFLGRRGRLQCRDASKSAIDCETGDNPSTLDLFDSSVGFCDGGAQGEKMKPAGDILEIIDDMPDPADPYWTTVVDKCSRQDCEEVFGTLDAPRVLDNGIPVGRDIVIETSYQGKLALKSSVATKWDLNNKQRHVPVTCCFPYPVAYNIRAGNQWTVTGSSVGFAHRMIPDPAAVTAGAPPDQQACIESCDPKLQLRNGRLKALTICSGNPPSPPDCVVPCSEGRNLPGCMPIPTYDNPAFQNAQLRFTLWDIEGTRCSAPPCSGRVRDRYFRFQESGGFIPMRFTLSTSSLVLPQSVRYVRGLDMLAIPDAVVMGLMLFDLNRLTTTSYFY